MAKIELIAQEAGTSIATVSRVLNNRGGVSERLRQKVRNVIRKHDFKPRLQCNRTTNLAVVIQQEHPILENFTASVLGGISRYSFEQGVDTTMIFLPTHSTGSEDLLQKIRERCCDAVILVFPQMFYDQIPHLASGGVPVMMIDCQYEIEGTGFIDNDSRGGSYQAVKHLLDLGHERIGILCGVMVTSYYDEHSDRLKGYYQAMQDAGLAVDPRWVISHTSTYRTQESGYIGMNNLLRQDPAVTAVFVNNDDMAYGAIRACFEKGLRVPEDISVVGFDDYATSKYYNPPLTTVRQPLDEEGYRAAKYADTMAKGAIVYPPREVLPTELIVRQSTTRVNSQRS